MKTIILIMIITVFLAGCSTSDGPAPRIIQQKLNEATTTAQLRQICEGFGGKWDPGVILGCKVGWRVYQQELK